jgi:hypothetical protein
MTDYIDVEIASRSGSSYQKYGGQYAKSKGSLYTHTQKDKSTYTILPKTHFITKAAKTMDLQDEANVILILERTDMNAPFNVTARGGGVKIGTAVQRTSAVSQGNAQAAAAQSAAAQAAAARPAAAQQAAAGTQQAADTDAIKTSRAAASNAAVKANTGMTSALAHFTAAQDARRRVAIAKTEVGVAKTRVEGAQKTSTVVNAAVTNVARNLTEADIAVRSANDKYNEARAAWLEAASALSSANGTTITVSDARSYAGKAEQQAVKAENAANAAKTAKESAETAASSAEGEVTKATTAATAAISAAVNPPSADLEGIKATAAQEARRAETERGNALEYKTAASIARASVAESKTAVEGAITEVRAVAGASLDVVNTELESVTLDFDYANRLVGQAESLYGLAVKASTDARTALGPVNVSRTTQSALTAAELVTAEANKAANAARDVLTISHSAARAKDRALTAASNAGAAATAAKQAAAQAATVVLGPQQAVNPPPVVVPGPAASPSQTELACTELARASLTTTLDIACATTAAASSVIIKGAGVAQLTVTVYKRASLEWGGYGTIVVGSAALKEGAKGVYVLIEKTGRIVTFVWHYHSKPSDNVVYDAKLIGARTYTLTRKTPVDPAAQTFSVTAVGREPNPFYEPTEAELDATACEALQKLASPGLVVCGPNSGDSSTVKIKRGDATVQVTLYKHTNAGVSYWAGYTRAATASASPGVYVKIQGKDDVTCVWEADQTATTVYKATRITQGTSSLPVVAYTLATGQTQATTMEHTAGGSPFPAMTQEEAASAEDAEKARSDACAELKKTMSFVRCDKTGTPTIVSIRRGTEALVNVSLYQDSSGSWAGYGLAPKVPVPPTTKGVYVSIGGMGAKCVWDSGASATQSILEYKATQAGAGSSTYTLVPVLTTTTTQVAETVVVVVVLSGTSPFPPTPVASTSAPSSSSGWKPSTEEIIGIVAGGVVGLLIIIAVVVLILKRRKGNEGGSYYAPGIDYFRNE